MRRFFHAELIEYIKDQTEQFQHLCHTGDVIRILTPPLQIPTQPDQLMCYKLLNTIEKESVHNISKAEPKYKVNKRFYTGKELDIQDAVQLFADQTRLFIKTCFVNTKGFTMSNDMKSKMHFFPFYNWEGITKYKIVVS